MLQDSACNTLTIENLSLESFLKIKILTWEAVYNGSSIVTRHIPHSLSLNAT